MLGRSYCSSKGMKRRRRRRKRTEVVYQLRLQRSWLCSWGRSPLHQLHSWPLCLYLSLSLSLMLCLVTKKWKEKKWFFYLMGLLLQRKWKEREGKSDFWTFFFFFEVDNFNFFSFFLWWFVWLPSKTKGIEGKEEMKGILWPSMCLRLFRCREKKKKKQRRKKSFFFSLCGFVWLLINEFCEGKMKGKNKKSDFWTF